MATIRGLIDLVDGFVSKSRAPEALSPLQAERKLNFEEQLIGQVIDDRYRIVRQIGSGAMGIVFEAYHLKMERRVAIKVLRDANERSVKLFEKECQALARVKSPAIPQLFGWGLTTYGMPYFVMEFIDYPSLHDLLKSKKVLEPELVSTIMVGVCDALTAIHEAGMVHRDVKPSNIMVSPADGSSKLTDLGIAKIVGSGATQTETVMGSLAFMSPEHYAPLKLDGRSDLFSLGSCIYMALVGKCPFEGANSYELAMNVTNGKRRATPGTVPDHLRYVISKCLQASPEKRFQSASDLKAALLAAGSNSALSDSGPIKVETSKDRRTKSSKTQLRNLIYAVTLIVVLMSVGGFTVWQSNNKVVESIEPAARAQSILELRDIALAEEKNAKLISPRLEEMKSFVDAFDEHADTSPSERANIASIAFHIGHFYILTGRTDEGVKWLEKTVLLLKNLPFNERTNTEMGIVDAMNEPRLQRATEIALNVADELLDRPPTAPLPTAAFRALVLCDLKAFEKHLPNAQPLGVKLVELSERYFNKATDWEDKTFFLSGMSRIKFSMGQGKDILPVLKAHLDKSPNQPHRDLPETILAWHTYGEIQKSFHNLDEGLRATTIAYNLSLTLHDEATKCLEAKALSDLYNQKNDKVRALKYARISYKYSLNRWQLLKIDRQIQDAIELGDWSAIELARQLSELGRYEEAAQICSQQEKTWVESNRASAYKSTILDLHKLSSDRIAK